MTEIDLNGYMNNLINMSIGDIKLDIDSLSTRSKEFCIAYLEEKGYQQDGENPRNFRKVT